MLCGTLRFPEPQLDKNFFRGSTDYQKSVSNWNRPDGSTVKGEEDSRVFECFIKLRFLSVIFSLVTLVPY